MFSKEKFGARLLELRNEKAEVQKSLAQLLGVTKTQISDMENGKIGTTLEKLTLICEHYNVSADYLLGLTEERRTLTIEENRWDERG